MEIIVKCFYISTEGAHDPGELYKYGYIRSSGKERESEPHGSHINPNPRTNNNSPFKI